MPDEPTAPGPLAAGQGLPGAPGAARGAGIWALYAQRWTAPILVQLAACGGGAKFVTLERALGVAKDSLARTLTAAIAAGWVVRNHGYGHPLRPEYLLTPAGTAAAAAIARLQAEQAALGLGAGALGRWGLPVLGALHAGPARFNAVARALAPVTSRALTASLASLGGQGLVVRSLIDAAPIAAIYAATPRASSLAQAARDAGAHLLS